MGVIKRQGFKNIIVQYFGVLIGFVSIIFIYPLAKTQFGLFRVLYDSAILLSPIILLGMSNASIKFFPFFKGDESSKNSFFALNLFVIFCGAILFVILFFPIYKYILSPLNEHSESSQLFHEYAFYLIPLTILIAFIRFFVAYISNFQRIVVPVIFDQLLIKITLPFLIVLYVNGIIGNSGLVRIIVLSYTVTLFALVYYLHYLGHLAIGKPFIKKIKTKLRDISTFSGYSVLTYLSTQIAFRLDTVMVGGLRNFSDAGFYAIIAVIVEIVSKPSKAIISVAGPIISKQIIAGQYQEVKKIYKSSSINLLLIGCLMFFCILLTINDVFLIMPNTDNSDVGFKIALVLGISHLINIGTSVNTEIIIYSKYYRFNVIAIVLLAFINIFLNLKLIPAYGLLGASIATLISISLINFAKAVFIWIKFKMQPFSVQTLYVIAIATTCYFLVYFLPSFNSPFLNILLKGGIFTFIYLISVIGLKISPEFNDMLLKLWTNYRDFLKL